jgi:hypothetical protein
MGARQRAGSHEISSLCGPNRTSLLPGNFWGYYLERLHRGIRKFVFDGEDVHNESLISLSSSRRDKA